MRRHRPAVLLFNVLHMFRQVWGTRSRLELHETDEPDFGAGLACLAYSIFALSVFCKVRCNGRAVLFMQAAFSAFRMLTGAGKGFAAGRAAGQAGSPVDTAAMEAERKRREVCSSFSCLVFH